MNEPTTESQWDDYVRAEEEAGRYTMPDQTEPTPEQIVLGEITALDFATEQVLGTIAHMTNGQTPDFSQLKVEVMIEQLHELGIVTTPQYNVIKLRIARAVHQKSVEVATAIDQEMRSRRAAQVRSTLMNGVPPSFGGRPKG